MDIEGTGPSLIDATPWLQDARERHERILDVTERNSVIEGLPAFSDETRRKILDELKVLSPDGTEPALPQ